MKKDIEESLQIMGVSIVILALTADILFPIIVLIFKLLLYIIGGLLLFLGIVTLVKSFRKKNKQEDGI